MTVVDVQRAPSADIENTGKIINDFSFVIATKNGTGSQTSNNTVLRTLFRMGIPINGKNLFPSNIYGLPTWYYIRLNKDGYRGHKAEAEVLVAYNFDTFAEDLKTLPSGGVCIYPLEWTVEPSRDDVYYYRIPVKDLTQEAKPPQAFREYVANMVYVGAMAYLFNLDMDEIRHSLNYNFNNKASAVDLNYGLVKMAYDWAEENLNKMDPYWCERMDEHWNDDMVLIDGNSAAALGTVFGGVHFLSWYPITPSSSLAESIQAYLGEYRHTEDGKATYAIVQAEDELAAIGMAIGSGWAGARGMTCTSGPGISLMSEFAGYAYFAEIPVVVWDIQRMGPSTGLPTRTSQGDVISTHFLSHGDTRQICLLPSDMRECFRFGWEAFDFAERLQMPVFVLSDLDLGMNMHCTRKFEYPDHPMDHGKVLSAKDLEEIKGKWGRYVDVDGDGITYRTLPGTDHPRSAYFTRGTGHNEMAVYSEKSEDWEKNLNRLARKVETARGVLPQPVEHTMDGATVGIVSYGSNDVAIEEARDMLAEAGVKTDYLRIRALPFSHKVDEFVDRFNKVYVVENNFEGQMAMIMRIDLPQSAAKLESVARCNGLPLDAEWITQTILEKEGK